MAVGQEAVREVYEEEHYEWDAGRWLCCHQHFTEGPLRKFVLLFSFREVGGQAQLEVAAGTWPKDDSHRASAEETATQGMAGFLDAFVSCLSVPRPPEPPLLRVPAPTTLSKSRALASSFAPTSGSSLPPWSALGARASRSLRPRCRRRSSLTISWSSAPARAAKRRRCARRSSSSG
jgi:hypothetical protein